MFMFGVKCKFGIKTEFLIVADPQVFRQSLGD